MPMDTTGLLLPKDPKGSHKFRRARQNSSKRKILRDAVWARDKGRDRATGQVVYRSALRMADRGQVCHLLSVGAHKELAYDPKNAVLMSELSHILSDARGNCRLKLTDPSTGERATDGSKPILFTLYRRDGSIEWQRIS